MRQKFFSVPFAVSGTQTTVADPTDSTGIVTFTQGWGPKYALDIADPLSLKIDRATTNYLFNVITGALAALQAVGTPEWITTSDNDGVALSYVKGASVRYSATPTTGPWFYYVSTVDNNTSVPGADTDWQLELQYAAAGSDVTAGTSNSLVVTPLSLSGLLPALPVSAGNGGTGRSTLTSHGVLIGEGASAVNQTAAGTTGQMLIGVTGADPAFGNAPTITGGSVNGTPVGATTPSTGAFTTLSATTPLPITSGGTGANTAATARTALSAAASGANNDITALSGLTTALSIAQGGTGSTTAAAAITALGGVDLVNNQTIAGTKTFSTRPVVGTATAGTNDTGSASTAFVGTAIANAGAAPKRTAPNFVNSGCLVAQRTSTSSLSTTRTIGPCDNIGAWASGGAVTAGNIGQDVGLSGLSGNGYAIKLTGVTLTGSGQISISIRMEAFDSAKYYGKNASFSVQVKQSTGAPVNYVLALNAATAGTNNFSTVGPIATSGTTSVPSGTWTTLQINNQAMPLACTSGIELEIRAACGAITSKIFEATEFYINIEPTAGTYDAPDYETELARCQRYLPAYNSMASGEYVGSGQAYLTTAALPAFLFKVPTRIPVTGVTASTAGNFALSSASFGALTCTGLTFNNASLGMGVLTATVTAGLVAGNISTLVISTNPSQILFTGAEL